MNFNESRDKLLRLKEKGLDPLIIKTSKGEANDPKTQFEVVDRLTEVHFEHIIFQDDSLDKMTKTS